MEVSALKYSGGVGLHGRSPLLRLQSDERLIALVRRGNQGAFEVLVSRYEVRLLGFCRHMLGSREDAEDVLQEVLAAAYNALLSDERPINLRPWLYRIARNRSLNHMRRQQAIASDAMDLHFSDHGASTADKVDDREEFRELVGDIHGLPESQRTALVLREMDALPYEQIAEAMDTTVPSVKSLLVRARISLAEASEARMLGCAEVRTVLGEVAEGLAKKTNPLVRRHVKGCERCTAFERHLKQNNRALAALMPIGLWPAIKGFALLHLGHSAGSGATAATAGSAGAGAGAGGASAGAGAAAVGGTATAATAASSGSLITTGIGALATKAAAGIAVAAIVTGGVVATHHATHTPPAISPAQSVAAGVAHAAAIAPKLAAPIAKAPKLTHRRAPLNMDRHHLKKVVTPVVATTTSTTVTPTVTVPTSTVTQPTVTQPIVTVPTSTVTQPTTTQPTTTTTPPTTTTTPTGSSTTTTESSTTPTGGTNSNTTITTKLPGS